MCDVPTEAQRTLESLNTKLTERFRNLFDAFHFRPKIAKLEM